MVNIIVYRPKYNEQHMLQYFSITISKLLKGQRWCKTIQNNKTSRHIIDGAFLTISQMFAFCFIYIELEIGVYNQMYLFTSWKYCNSIYHDDIFSKFCNTNIPCLITIAIHTEKVQEFFISNAPIGICTFKIDSNMLVYNTIIGLMDLWGTF